ncbi:hypothetical protein OM427_07755 [Halomonas sp. 18H]|uniref:hypothetical protein n=1 Tax=Halomonas almeriensis TaxID=308163 RepID=UPI00222F7D27|nr:MULTISPECIES: hypothetical protein [Halomonas]MCW4149427.1 hypothetical protein [Halomonas sp. 18H]MDN3553627.1 hypothetical protein [Halomonas almeriensis]
MTPINPDRIDFRPTCLRAVAYILVIIALMEGVMLEARQPIEQEFSEVGFTEFTQTLLLVLAGTLTLFARWRYQQLPRVTLLLIGLFGASLIREQDSWLDHYVADGAWQVLVSLLVAPVLYQVARHRRAFVEEMNRYSGTFSFGLFAAGFLTTYVFSRLFGRGELWQAMLAEGYVRVFKNAAEEVSEMFGYTLLVLAMVELLLLMRRWHKASA